MNMNMNMIMNSKSNSSSDMDIDNDSQSDISLLMLNSSHNTSIASINNNNINNNNNIKYQLKLDYGHFEDQGKRETMEDSMVIMNEFNVISSLCSSGIHSLFAIFDGHSGSECSKYCSNHLPILLKKYMIRYSNINTVFNETINELDNNFIDYDESNVKENDQGSGSTGCIVLIDKIKQIIHTCNIGDSRCVLVSQNDDDTNESTVKQLSIEHKPGIESEKKRIKQAGGFVSRGIFYFYYNLIYFVLFKI